MSGGASTACLREGDYDLQFIFGFWLVFHHHWLFFDQSYVNGVGRLIQVGRDSLFRNSVRWRRRCPTQLGPVSHIKVYYYIVSQYVKWL